MPRKRAPRARPAKYNLSEAADYLGVSPAYLKKRTLAGLVVCFHPSPNKWVFDKSALDTYRDRNTIGTTP